MRIALLADIRGNPSIEYDRQAAIEAARRSGNPGADYVIQFLEGKIRASGLAKWDGTSHAVLSSQ